MIATQDLSVELGKKQVVSAVSFQAVAGELTAVIGPNGSGKTSLLRALAGEVQYRGSATLNGHEVSRTQAWKLALNRAVLPQFSTVMFPFTVREVVCLGGLAKNQDMLDLPEQALAKVGLSGFGGRKYNELSGGEQQRVQFARVLVQVWGEIDERNPCWLFLDEPISSLDIQHQLTIMNIAKEFAQSGGGVIAVLHDLNIAAMFSDKILLMLDGSPLSIGKPAEVLKNATLNKAFSCNLKVGKTPPKSEQF
ncbi:MAG: heme ABC transporter ATP-binding protein, partial [Pseudomonadota bacterium]